MTDRAAELLRLRESVRIEGDVRCVIAEQAESGEVDYVWLKEQSGAFLNCPAGMYPPAADFAAFCMNHAAAIVAELQATIARLEQENAILRAKAEYHDASTLVGKMYYGFFGDTGVTNAQVDAARERLRVAAEALHALSPEYFEQQAEVTDGK